MVLLFKPVDIKTETIRSLKFTIKERVLFGKNKSIWKGKSLIPTMNALKPLQNTFLDRNYSKLQRRMQLYRGGIRIAARFKDDKQLLEIIVQNCFNLPFWVKNPRLSCSITPYTKKSPERSPSSRVPKATSPEFNHCFTINRFVEDFFDKTMVTIQVKETNILLFNSSAEKVIGRMTIGAAGQRKSTQFWKQVAKKPGKYHYQTFTLTK